MRPKKFQKKLTLKKQTISHLEEKQQDAVRGGTINRSIATICGRVTDCGDTCGVTVCGITCCGSDPCSC